MKVGITGHQSRPGINWSWVAKAIASELQALPSARNALTSLAAGSDQVFAECALAAGMHVLAIIPINDYERFFKDDDLRRYRNLLKASEILELSSSTDPQQAFYAAGRYIVENCDFLIAIWDEKPAAGLGGTADVVEYAQVFRRDIVIINPVEQSVRRMSKKIEGKSNG